ncbi:MAG TPA: hypothetical protein VEU52_01415 [Candidatus Limnocylindrales bacterium]|nr:hypothetical protein [Candidatus Limnocylindrales bacterium]
MNIVSHQRPPTETSGTKRRTHRILSGLIALPAAALFLFLAPRALGQTAATNAWSVVIVLPPKVVAGHPATLAVFGVDGRLASGVAVELGKDQRVTTDATGRADFTVAHDIGGVLIAKASGSSAAALVDPAGRAEAAAKISVPPFVSIKDRFAICGGAFRGDADANHVRINGDAALVLAASPECLVLLPGPRLIPGAAQISVDAGGAQASAATTLVSLLYEPPQPPLAPEKKSRLAVAVQGTEQPLELTLENQTPGVLRFLRGDSQEVRSSGGAQNSASVDVVAIRSGDFSFRSRLEPAPDPAAAARYLAAAAPLAPKDLQRRLKNFAERLAKHPNDAAKIRREVEKFATATIEGDLRTLLRAAADSL